MDCSTIFQSLPGLFLNASTAIFAAETSGEGGLLAKYGILVIALAVIILPFIAGAFLAKKLKMPTHGTRLGWVLFAIVGSAAILINKLPGLGVDLRGGTILVYEIDPSKNRSADDENPMQRIKSDALIEPLMNRVNPSGTREIVIRPYGDNQIEVIVPEVDQREVEEIKRKIADAGVLRFAIVANQIDHKFQIDLATERAQSTNPAIRGDDLFLNDEGQAIAMWTLVDRERPESEGDKTPFRVDVSSAILRNVETGVLVNLPPEIRNIKEGPAKQAQWMDDQEISGLEILMIVDPDFDVTGEDLAFASTTFDERGGPAVAFNLTDSGSGKFFGLTSENAPDGERERQLGIILDEKLLSAPSLQQAIRKQGRITGRFTQAEVQGLVDILKAGQLPTALTEMPIAENLVDATLGADTIRKGVIAIVTSLGLVLLFIFFYYRFAGLVACVALLLNLGMILATMVFINQPLTLPGLAGLVLTVGMSVDANVLIFERIREELKKGAKPRMAIRNGFAKATVTIVDANLTTLLTAIVLYAIGTDQIRGFAVTLILGILFSMFTAIYMSRTLFDIAERRGFLTLKMSDGVNSLRAALSGEGNLDFVSKGKLTLAVSAVLICVGIGALYARGKNILDIDFAGGSSVQFRLNKPTSSEDVQEIVKAGIGTMEDGTAVQFTLNGVTMEQADDDTVYKVDAGIEDVNVLKQRIVESFAAAEGVNLLKYGVEVSGGGTATDSTSQFLPAGFGEGTMLTAARAQDESAEADESAETAPAEPDSTTDANGDAAESTSTDEPGGDSDSTATPSSETSADDSEANDSGPPSDPSATNDADAEVSDATDSESTEDASVRYETTKRQVNLSVEGTENPAQLSGPTLVSLLKQTADDLKIPLSERAVIVNPEGEGATNWKPGSSVPFSTWTVELPMDNQTANELMGGLQSTLSSDPIWVSSSSVGKRVAGQMVARAGVALFASLIAIIGYIWFRFQRVIYGFAAVAALVHDVLITLGAIAISFWLAGALGFLLIDPFKISLTVVAALLTIIGYSLNDTIVVFDRIRETKGKAPRLTGEMVNVSINQTLSRTLLTSVTTLIVVLLLYAFGGDGIHAFAFALVIGVLVGTYSSIFVASPILLWLVSRDDKPAAA